ncbi:MAG: hypothetical protein JJ900_00380 [Rhodospirillales bacterium]|nr:hypothetical protein [Rhodospirillales bacterium]MBO6785272.1 hypothetical protein [Rhodospirillales bacterium]
MDATELATAKDVRAAFRVEDLRSFRTTGGLHYAIVAHNPESRLITDKWVGAFEDVDAFRAVLEFICERFETGSYSYWLADLRYMSASFFHSEDWLADVVFPRVIAAGLRREAVVLPPDDNLPEAYDVFGSASHALRKITDGRVQGFQDIEIAKAWLFQDPNC